MLMRIYRQFMPSGIPATSLTSVGDRNSGTGTSFSSVNPSTPRRWEITYRFIVVGLMSVRNGTKSGQEADAFAESGMLETRAERYGESSYVSALGNRLTTGSESDPE